MANSISAMDNFLKENVHPMMMDAISIRSKERQLFGEIKKVPVDGKYYRLDVLTKGNFRLEGRQERGTLPGNGYAPTGTPATSEDIAAPLGSIELKFKRKYLYSILDFSGPANSAPLTSAGGYSKLSKMVIDQTLAAFPESVSRCWAGGQAAPLAEVASRSSATVTVVAANAPTLDTSAEPWSGNRLLREGMVVDCVQVSSNSVIAGDIDAGTDDRGRMIDSVSADGTTPTFTFDSAPTAVNTAGDLIIPFATRATGGINDTSAVEDSLYMPHGILDAVQNSATDPNYAINYYGTLDRTAAANRVLQSKHIDNNTPVPLTLDMLNRLVEQIRVDSLGGEEPDTFYCTDSVYRKFIENAGFTTMSNFATNNPSRFVNPGKGFSPTVGVKGIEVNNIGSKGSVMFFTSPLAPHYRVYAITKKNLMVLQDKELGVLDDDGLKLRQIEGQDAWQIQYRWYQSGIINTKPLSCGYITGVLGDHNN